MGRDDTGVVVGGGDGQRGGSGGTVHVVELDEVVVLDHLVDDVGPEACDAADVALRAVAVDGQLTAVEQRGERAVDQRGQRTAGRDVDLGRVLVLRRARRQRPETPGLLAVARVDHDPELTGDHLGAAEGVVELVDGEEGADAEIVDLLEPRVDLRLVALGDVVDLAAAEDARDLDALDDGELALVDHPARLERVGDDAEPPLAGSARLGVDVVLQRVQVPALDLHRVHVVAGVAGRGHQRAQRLVVDQIGDHETQAGLPGPFDAGVVVALLGQRRRARPVHERRPAVHVGRPCRSAVVDERLERAVGPLLVGGAACGQRVDDAERAPRPAAVPVPAQELERGDVGVALDGAEHVGLGAGAAERRAHRVDLGLGVGGAAGGGDEGDGQARARAGIGHGEPLRRGPVHRPLRGGAGRAGAGEIAGAVVGEIVTLRSVEQIDAQRRRLHREGADAGGNGRAARR